MAVCYWRQPTLEATRVSSLATVVARHFAPRAVGTCRRFNSSAMALSLVKPACPQLTDDGSQGHSPRIRGALGCGATIVPTIAELLVLHLAYD